MYSIIFIFSGRQSSEEHVPNESLTWYHKLNWILFNTNATASLFVGVGYWGLMAPGRTMERNLYPVTFHLHTTSMIVTLIDLFVIAFPVRLLHVIYPALYLFAYIIYNLILHWTGTDSSVYSFLDWDTKLGTAVGFSVGLVLIGPPIIQCLLYGLYHAKLALFKCIFRKSSEANSDSLQSNNGVDNPAFDRSNINTIASSV